MITLDHQARKIIEAARKDGNREQGPPGKPQIRGPASHFLAGFASIALGKRWVGVEQSGNLGNTKGSPAGWPEGYRDNLIMAMKAKMVDLFLSAARATNVRHTPVLRENNPRL